MITSIHRSDGAVAWKIIGGIAAFGAGGAAIELVRVTVCGFAITGVDINRLAGFTRICDTGQSRVADTIRDLTRLFFVFLKSAALELFFRRAATDRAIDVCALRPCLTKTAIAATGVDLIRSIVVVF